MKEWEDRYLEWYRNNSRHVPEDLMDVTREWVCKAEKFLPSIEGTLNQFEVDDMDLVYGFLEVFARWWNLRGRE